MVHYLKSVISPITPEMIEHFNKPGINLFVGSARSGKTATMFFFNENIYLNREIRYYKMPESMKTVFPDEYKIIDSLKEIEGGEVINFDDTAMFVDARSWGSTFNKQFLVALTVSGHWPSTSSYTSQSLKLVDVGNMAVIRFTVIQKIGELDNLQYERDEWKDRLYTGYVTLKKVVDDFGLDEREVAYIHRPFNCVIHTPLAKGWKPEYSVPYKDYRFENWGEKCII